MLEKGVPGRAGEVTSDCQPHAGFCSCCLMCTEG